MVCFTPRGHRTFETATAAGPKQASRLGMYLLLLNRAPGIASLGPVADRQYTHARKPSRSDSCCFPKNTMKMMLYLPGVAEPINELVPNRNRPRSRSLFPPSPPGNTSSVTQDSAQPRATTSAPVPLPESPSVPTAIVPTLPLPLTHRTRGTKHSQPARPAAPAEKGPQPELYSRGRSQVEERLRASSPSTPVFSD